LHESVRRLQASELVYTTWKSIDVSMAESDVTDDTRGHTPNHENQRCAMQHLRDILSVDEHNNDNIYKQ